jgi:uncharacterized protein (TIGR01777 family)
MTGVTGWIGKQLGLALVRRGHQLICLVRDPVKAAQKCPFPAEWVKWSDEKPLDQMVFSQKIDCLIHLAGEGIADHPWTKERKDKILRSRQVSTENLVALCNRLQIPHFISTSAIGFYGDQGDDTLDESSSSGNGFLSEVCQAWEAPLQKLSPEIRSAIVRIGVVLGPGGGALEKMLMPFQFGLGGRLGSGRQWVSWIHIADLQNIFLKVIEDQSYMGVFNGTTPRPVQQVEFARMVAKTIKTTAWVPTPAFVLKGALGERSHLVLDSAKVFPRHLEKMNFHFQFGDLELALQQILAHEVKGERLLVCEQFIDQPLEKVFPFFANEMNLEQITPPFLNFKVLKKTTPEIEKGTVIFYQLGLYGVPFKWYSWHNSRVTM